MADASWVIVDDRDPTIAYSVAPGAVIWHGGVSQEYDQTTTGLDAGDTLTYYFNASMIGVFGTYGPTDASGPPVAVYQVDNAPPTTVTAPITQSTLYRQGFWTSDTLSPLAGGAFHKLVVTATAPNETLWVDYLAYPPPPGVHSATTTSSSLSSPSPSSGSPSPASESTAFAVAPSNTVGTQPVSSTSHTSVNVSTIVAAVVVGTFGLIASAVALVYIWRRRSRSAAHSVPGGGNRFPAMSQSGNYSASLTQPVMSNLSGSENTTPRSEGLPQQLPRPLPPTPTRTADGGVSVMGGPLDMPPEYREHY